MCARQMTTFIGCGRRPNYTQWPSVADIIIIRDLDTAQILCEEQFFVIGCSSQVGKGVQFTLLSEAQFTGHSRDR